LQRQLLGLLRNLGADILLATHSTEIISEAEPDEIVVINKARNAAKRIRHPSELTEVFSVLASNLNPVLTQLAKTRRALFLEGKDFQIIGRFARRLGEHRIANRSDFALVPIEGFNPERARSLKAGMETTLGTKISALVVLDGDYRCPEERKAIVEDCGTFSDAAIILTRKEIENFLLVPSALERAVKNRIADRSKRSGKPSAFEGSMESLLEELTKGYKSRVTAQLISNRRRFQRANSPKTDDAVVTQQALQEMDDSWTHLATRLAVLPGKEFLSGINQKLQEKYQINITPTGIIDCMKPEEIPAEIVGIIRQINSVVSNTASTIVEQSTLDELTSGDEGF
jgi:hypothetical protein